MQPRDHPSLEAFRAVPPGRAGIFTDFDGTLSPIVPRPEDARPQRGAGPVLARLARRYAVVAIVTGRAASDVGRRLRAPGVRIVGVHGLEEKFGRRVRVMPDADAARRTIEDAAVSLERRLASFDGIVVERKGLGLAVHMRNAPDPDAAERAVTEIVAGVAREAGLAAHGGRRVVEIRPLLPTDKGTAIVRLAREAGIEAALFCGDDIGDLVAMHAVRSLPVSSVVGVASPESPAELREAADVIVDGPADVVRILRRLTD
ncbi:MAG TPA: trehalose-phosphatase [Actinomycetota bacterium]|nr:trehalose-phosphatase [Actinomycetota bacterium]